MAKRSGKKKVARKGDASLNGVSTVELARELRRRERQLSKLETKRDSLLSQVASLDQEIASLGALVGAGGGIGGVRRRPKNDRNLSEALQELLKGTTMSVTEAAEAVQAAGYKTSAANFRVIVNQTLLREKSRFKKVARGQYTAK